MSKLDPTVLYQLGYGVYIVGAKDQDRLNAQVANTVFQITSEPMTVAVSINKQNLTHQLITAGGVFTVSILSTETPISFIGQFGFKSGRDVDKLAGVEYRLGATGAPIVLEYALGCFEARVVSSTDCGTHTLFVGEVVAGERLQAGEPMTYAYYHQVKRGTSPKTAPTYIAPPQAPAAEVTLPQYVCTVCGYTYHPEDGDPVSGIKPGTPFEELPADWTCPLCGAPKSMFRQK